MQSVSRVFKTCTQGVHTLQRVIIRKPKSSDDLTIRTQVIQTPQSVNNRKTKCSESFYDTVSKDTHSKDGYYKKAEVFR